MINGPNDVSQLMPVISQTNVIVNNLASLLIGIQILF